MRRDKRFMAFFPGEHWDASVEEWDKTVENRDFPHYFYYYEADLYIDDVLKDSKLALELGAGTCGSTLRHVSENARIVALDYSAAMLHVGRAKLLKAGLYPHVDLAVADECHLPFKDESVDAVFSRGVALSYASDPELFANEAYRVLRKGRPIGFDFMNRLMADKSKRGFRRFERINGVLYYVEQFNEGRNQKRVGYMIPDYFQSPEPIAEGQAFGTLGSKPDWLRLEGLQRKEWWAVFYSPSEAEKLFRSAGFRAVNLYPLGCFSYGVRNKELYEFLRDNREYICKLQKKVAGIFKLEAGVHIFLQAVRPEA